MSRPYPVGEKVAGHKLASLIINTVCTKADFIVRTGKLANACALQDGLSKDPRRRVGFISSCVTLWSKSYYCPFMPFYTGTT